MHPNDTNPPWLTGASSLCHEDGSAEFELVVTASKRQRKVWRQLNIITVGFEKFPGAAVQ